MKRGCLMVFYIVAVVLLFGYLLTGCAGYDAFKVGVASHGAQAADAELEAAEWGICQAATMGSWQRRYGNQPEKVQGWKQLCGKTVETP